MGTEAAARAHAGLPSRPKSPISFQRLTDFGKSLALSTSSACGAITDWANCPTFSLNSSKGSSPAASKDMCLEALHVAVSQCWEGPKMRAAARRECIVVQYSAVGWVVCSLHTMCRLCAFKPCTTVYFLLFPTSRACPCQTLNLDQGTLCHSSATTAKVDWSGNSCPVVSIQRRCRGNRAVA